MSAASAALASNDPTGSKTKRESLASLIGGRWETVIGDLREEIQNNQRLRPSSNRSPARQTSEFRSWLDQEIRSTVVEEMPPGGVINGNHYSGTPIREGVLHGAILGTAHLKRAGADVESLSYNEAERLIQRPHFQRALEREYQDTYDDIFDIAQSAHTDASRNYRDAAAAGVGLSTLYTGRIQSEDGVNDRLRKAGKSETTNTAHYHIASAVNAGAAHRYYEAGVEELGTIVELDVDVSSSEGEVEFVHAGDSRVCPRCESLGGTIFKTAGVIRGSVESPPIHGRCRCLLIPHVS